LATLARPPQPPPCGAHSQECAASVVPRARTAPPAQFRTRHRSVATRAADEHAPRLDLGAVSLFSTNDSAESPSSSSGGVLTLQPERACDYGVEERVICVVRLSNCRLLGIGPPTPVHGFKYC